MIYLTRHGETEFNRERRLQGHVDSPLTDLGVRQADAVGRLLADLIGDPQGWRIVSSPLGRAHRTAEIIAGRLGGVPTIELEPRLMEITLGENDGRPREELEAEHPGASRWIFGVPGCEPYSSVTARLQSWLDALPPEPDRKVIAVSHGVTGRVLRGLYAGLGREQAAEQDVPQDAVYRLAHGGVARIDCEPLD